MLDYASLSALAAVVREGSFERAARTLHVTPSAISQRVRLLEERAGCAMVVRGQPCRATYAGRRLCQHLDRVHPQALIATQLKSGALVELVPHSPLDVPLYWQQARAASSLLDGLTRAVLVAARAALVQG